MPALSISDNGDGTGATATITAADATASITVYWQAVDGQLGGGTWTSAGSRTGDGTLVVALVPGYYWFKAVSSIAGGTSTSNVVYSNVTSGQTAVLYRCLAAVQARLQLLALADVGNSSIVVKKIPLDRNAGAPAALALPAILVTPERETMDPEAGVNQRDDVGYRVRVTLLDRDNQEKTLSANLDKYLLWREQIARAFRHQRLSGVPEIFTCVVEPEEIVEAQAWAKNLFASSLVLKLLSREPRGM